MFKRNGIDRRQFVALGVSSAAAVAFTPKLMAAGWSAAPAAVADVSVGYCDGMFMSRQDATGEVRSAEALFNGDPAFIERGARVSVYGMGGGETSAIAHPKNRIELTTHFSVDDAGCRRLIPFMAWSYSRERMMKSTPSTFVVPVNLEQRLILSVAGAGPTASGRGRIASRNSAPSELSKQGVPPVVGDCTSAGAMLSHSGTESWITLETSSGSGAKLSRGFYFIAPLAMGESAPQWSGLALRSAWVEKEKATRWVLYDGNSPVDFEYLVLWIDYARYDQEESPVS